MSNDDLTANTPDTPNPQFCVHEDAVFWNPYNHLVQCHRCGEVFVPGQAATPADAIFAFGAWLTSRSEKSGPFSRVDDAAQMAELAGAFCKFNGWEVGPNYPHTFKMPPDGGWEPTAETWPVKLTAE